MEQEDFETRYKLWRERLNEASGKWGGVEICAVTKTVDASIVNHALDCGVDLIGENRVQELRDKAPLLTRPCRKHIIGQLQTNKVKYLIGLADMIQSVDRMNLAEEISRQAEKKGVIMPVLVQVGIAKEPQKGGVYEEELVDFLTRASVLPGLSVRGLMAIMPKADDPEDVRPYFKRMRVWFDELRDHPVGNARMEILSIGMSHDCLIAAQEGATMVRIGSALFGERPHR